MRMICIIFSMLLATAVWSSAHARSVTFYADGALVETGLTANRGTVDISLPSNMIDGTLRIRPEGGSIIQRVDMLAAQGDRDTEKEMETLVEQKNRLNDRLQALATREEIFTTAAKSQSGKAPRKSKANPDPMQAIRQGTDFAIAQLEAVYTARRRTEQEIRRIDSRISALKSGKHVSEAVARVFISPAKGRITVKYALSQQGWTPRYDIQLNGDGTADIQLSGQLPVAFSGFQLKASPSYLSESPSAPVFQAQPGSVTKLSGFRFPVSEEFFRPGIRTSFSCLVTNTSPVYLPAGDAGIYRKGEYLGRFRFEGISSGRSRKMTMGPQ